MDGVAISKRLDTQVIEVSFITPIVMTENVSHHYEL